MTLATPSSTEVRDLFGGAITAQLPGGLIDAADLRQVPDNQEVLLFPQSEVTCIVEVLEQVTEDEAATDLEAAIRFHFASLAHDNEATSSKVLSVRQPRAVDQHTQSTAASDLRTPAPIVLQGEQTVRKFNKDDSPIDLVRIHFALWRLAPHRNVDLVMSWNEPIGQQGPAPEANEAAPSNSSNAQGSEQVASAFARAAESLQIRDWGLFPQ